MYEINEVIVVDIRSKGQQAEQSALDYLQEQGLQLLMRNYQCRVGEIDLIMKDKTNLVFVEVRYRKNVSHGSSAESVTPAKQRRISNTALFYLQQNNLYEKVSCRFDVIAIGTKHNADDIEWIRDAFQVMS